MKKCFLLIALISLLFHCTKEEQLNPAQQLFVQSRDALPDPIELLGLLEEVNSGFVHLHSYTTLASQPLRGEAIHCGAVLWDEQGAKDYGALSVGGLNFTADPQNGYRYGYDSLSPSAENFYGATASVALAGAGNDPTPLLEDSFYVSPLLTIDQPAWEQGLTLGPGDELRWNSDPGNELGIGIVVRYDPARLENGRQFEAEEIYHYAHVPDNGSYTLTTENFAGIPAGKLVQVYVGRGNFKKAAANDGIRTFGLYAYSVVAIPAYYQ